MKLNENSAQEEAVKTIYGPVIIIACPGAGKTTTLIRRIHNMIENGIDERSILMVTFTVDAAKNMKDKYLQMYKTFSEVTFSTFHSFCFRVLMTEGLRGKDDIMEEREMIPQISSYLENVFGLRDAFETARLVCGEISGIKNNYIDVSTYESESVESSIFRKAYEKYHDILKQNNKIDFEDMMLETEELFNNRPDVLKKWQNRYRFIQCDEYQDTNPIQKNILYKLAGTEKNLCVVGDDDQSIYRFRGAEPRIMFDFEKDFSGCRTIYMSTNYRSGQTIVDIADCLIKENQTRFRKDFISFRGQNGFEGKVDYKKFPERESEIRYLINKIKQEHANGRAYRDMAVLYRNNNLAGYVLTQMSEEKIPYRSKDKLVSKYDTWEFKTLCAYIRLSMGKYNASHIAQMIRTPNKYLSPKMFKDCRYDLGELVMATMYINEDWKREKAVSEFRRIFEAFPPGRFNMESSPSLIMKSFYRIGIEKAVEDRARMMRMDYSEALDTLDFLDKEATKYDTLKEWFAAANTDIKRVEQINSQRDEMDGVTVSTMHGAKGCEWDKVFVIDVVHNIIPTRNAVTPDAVEEERRVLYVALTRAKDDLEILCGGTESEFMWTLMRELDRKKKQALLGSRPSPGTTVRSPRFGLGVVLDYSAVASDRGKLTVDFAGQRKEFYYPDAFSDGFLKILK